MCFSHLHHICKYFSGNLVPCEAFIFQWKKSRTQKGRLNVFRNKQSYKTTWALLEINPKTKANSWSGLAAGGSSAWEFLALESNMGSILLAGCICDQLVSARAAFPIWMDLDILLALLYCSYFSCFALLNAEGSWMEILEEKNITKGTDMWQEVPWHCLSCDRHRRSVSQFHTLLCPCGCEDGEAGLCVCSRRAAAGTVQIHWWPVVSAMYTGDPVTQL